MREAICFSRVRGAANGSSFPLARTPAFSAYCLAPPRSFVSDFGTEDVISAIVRIGNFGLGNTTIFRNYWISQPSWLAPNGNLIVANFDNFKIISLAFTGGDTVGVTVLLDLYNYLPSPDRPTDVGGTPWLSLFITQQTLATGLRLAPSTAIGSMWSNVQGVWVDC